MINYEIKSQLAKLLATEDLIVEHKDVTCASFDVDKRVLTLPLWKRASNVVYDLLVGHEVGHALFTPNEDWFRHTKIPRQFLNVTEDVRVEKLMKRKYPGLAKTFYKGYKELNEQDFFEIENENIDDLNLADRSNLYFKVGNFLDLSFSPIEKQIVDLIGRSETFQEALDAAKILYDYCLNPQEEEKDEIVAESSSKHDYDPEHMDESDEIEEEKEDVDEREPSSDGPSQQKSDTEVKTDSAFNERVQELVGDSPIRENFYFEVPKVNLDSIIIDNSTVHQELRDHWKQQLIPMEMKIDGKVCHHVGNFEWVDYQYENFKQKAQKEVNYLVKEFECKKSADAYARATTSRTGILDMSKLHQYKFNEDIFKKVTTLADGKNHGLIFILDWSGSMNTHLLDTIKQLYNLIWFCSKVQIPFEVYSFTNNYSDPENPIDHMEQVDGHLFVPPDFSLLNFFTSDISKPVLEEQMRSIWRLVNGINYYVDYVIPGKYNLSGTPLNEALISLHQIIPSFKKKNNLQKVQCVILTDGEANLPLVCRPYTSRDGDVRIGLRRITPKYSFIRNRKTGHVYQVLWDHWKFTEILLNDLKETYPDINFIGIRLISSRELGVFVRRYDKVDDTLLKKIRKQKAYAIKESGYESYIVMLDSDISQDSDFCVTDYASKSQIKKAFAKSLSTKKLNKKVLSEFIELVA